MKPQFLALALASLGPAASAQDWSGPFIGLQTGNSSFTNQFYRFGLPGDEPFDGGGNMQGGFFGYDHQIGNLVLGGEIAYLSGKPAMDLSFLFHFDGMLDLKARAGYALGRVLPYAVVGWSKTKWTNFNSPPIDADGLAFGVGAEFRATDRIVVGIEYLHRNLVSDPFVFDSSYNLESDFSTVSLRVAFAF